MSLATYSVRSVRLRIRFTPQSSLGSFNELTDLYMFMRILAHTGHTVVSDDVGGVDGLIVGEAAPTTSHSFISPLVPCAARFTVFCCRCEVTAGTKDNDPQ